MKCPDCGNEFACDEYPEGHPWHHSSVACLIRIRAKCSDDAKELNRLDDLLRQETAKCDQFEEQLAAARETVERLRVAVSIASKLVEYIDREGPPALEWKAQTELCEQFKQAISDAPPAAPDMEETMPRYLADGNEREPA